MKGESPFFHAEYSRWHLMGELYTKTPQIPGMPLLVFEACI